MRSLAAATMLSAAALAAGPANACLVLEGRNAEEKALRAADLVVTVEALTQDLRPDPTEPGIFRGSATGRVSSVQKGRMRIGKVVAYRVSSGKDVMGCPEFRQTVPGRTYDLYLRRARPGEPWTVIRRAPFYD